MHLEILTPSSKLEVQNLRSITMQGVTGEFTVLPGHCKFAAALKDGPIKVVDEKNNQKIYFIVDGLAFVDFSLVTISSEECFQIENFLSGETKIEEKIQNCVSQIAKQKKDSIPLAYWESQLARYSALKLYLNKIQANP